MNNTTFAAALSKDRVEFDVLHRRYGPVLNMVNVLIGVVPYCDRYLEIWPPGFRTYNLMVPNFLNLPATLVGRGAPKDLVGLGMYLSSRAANCNYCSAHTCSFALRRGSSTDAVTGETRSPAEQAVAAFAEALSSDPHYFTADLKAGLSQHLNDAEVEWVAMGVVMMGFLNKFMDAVGVELEPEAVNDVSGLISQTGWSVGQHGWAGVDDGNGSSTHEKTLPPVDSIGTMLRVARNAPGAIRLEKKWMAPIAKDADVAISEISDRYGFDASMLSQMMHAKPQRALIAMLAENLNPSQSKLGIGLKSLVGLIFGTHVDNAYVIERAEELAQVHGVAESDIMAAKEFATGSASSSNLDDRTLAVFTVARVMSPSPAVVDTGAIESANKSLSSAEIVEIAVWVSVNQLLHRLSVYYGDGIPA